ncbi:Protein of unknown function [Pyronema omphalodes CBS 100304]
MLPAQ